MTANRFRSRCRARRSVPSAHFAVCVRITEIDRHVDVPEPRAPVRCAATSGTRPDVGCHRDVDCLRVEVAQHREVLPVGQGLPNRPVRRAGSAARSAPTLRRRCRSWRGRTVRRGRPRDLWRIRPRRPSRLAKLSWSAIEHSDQTGSTSRAARPGRVCSVAHPASQVLRVDDSGPLRVDDSGPLRVDDSGRDERLARFVDPTGMPGNEASGSGAFDIDEVVVQEQDTTRS